MGNGRGDCLDGNSFSVWPSMTTQPGIVRLRSRNHTLMLDNPQPLSRCALSSRCSSIGRKNPSKRDHAELQQLESTRRKGAVMIVIKGPRPVELPSRTAEGNRAVRRARARPQWHHRRADDDGSMAQAPPWPSWPSTCSTMVCS